MLASLTIPGRVIGGRWLPSASMLSNDTIALNLSRPADRELLPALFESDDTRSERRSSHRRMHVSQCDATSLVARGRSMGLAIAAEREDIAAPIEPCVELTAGRPANSPGRRTPRVVDLSALWAGPLASHLLWLAGAEVIKVESRTRPDAMREGDSRVLCTTQSRQGQRRRRLQRPRTIDQRCIRSSLQPISSSKLRGHAHLRSWASTPREIVRRTPGLVWITITGHGARRRRRQLGWIRR